MCKSLLHIGTHMLFIIKFWATRRAAISDKVFIEDTF